MAAPSDVRVAVLGLFSRRSAVGHAVGARSAPAPGSGFNCLSRPARHSPLAHLAPSPRAHASHFRPAQPRLASGPPPRVKMRAAAVLCLLLGAADAATHSIGTWTAEYGFCKGAPPRRGELDPIVAANGDRLAFYYVRDANHDVYEYADEDHYDRCDITGGTQHGAPGDGSCTDPVNCESTSTGDRATGGGVIIPVEELSKASYARYFGSSAECADGVRVRVHMPRALWQPANRAVGTAAPKRIEVDNWTDDWGYCESSPYAGPKEEQAEIVAMDGDTLVFKYSTKHNV